MNVDKVGEKTLEITSHCKEPFKRFIFCKKNCVKSTIDTELLKNQSEVDFASKTKNQNLLQLDDNRQYEFKLDRLCIGQAPTSKYLCRKVEIYEQKYY